MKYKAEYATPLSIRNAKMPQTTRVIITRVGVLFLLFSAIVSSFHRCSLFIDFELLGIDVLFSQQRACGR